MLTGQISSSYLAADLSQQSCALESLAKRKRRAASRLAHVQATVRTPFCCGLSALYLWLPPSRPRG